MDSTSICSKNREALNLNLFIYSGSSLDFYHTPPTSPSDSDLAAMALPSAASADSVQTPSPAASITPSSTSVVPDGTQKLSAPSEWAVINEDSVSSGTNSSDAAVKREKAAVDSSVLPSEQSWRERDSGMEPQAAAEKDEDAMTLVLLSLMEHYRAPLGLTPNTDVTSGAVGEPSNFTCTAFCQTKSYFEGCNRQ